MPIGAVALAFDSALSTGADGSRQYRQFAPLIGIFTKP
jgi:hypothetical protein